MQTKINTKINTKIVAKITTLGTLLNPLGTLIKSLSPVFWIEDMTEVVDGKLVDKSGNNKQIAVTTVTSENDTITMPANDADIIAALTADGMYNVFYTTDAAPKAVKIGAIIHRGARRIYSYHNLQNFCLFPNEPTIEQQTELFTYLSIPLSYSKNCNLLKANNFYQISNPNNLLDGTAYLPLFLMADLGTADTTTSITDSVSPFSVYGKKVKRTVSLTGVRQPLSSAMNSGCGGRYKVSFWINKTNYSPDRFCVGYLTLTGYSNTPLIVLENPQINSVGYTWTNAVGATTGKVVAVNGDWSLIECSFTARSNGDLSNIFNFRASNLQCGIGFGTETVPVDIEYQDIIIMKDYSEPITGVDNIQGPYELMQSNIAGKTMLVSGDSITNGGSFMLSIEFNYGLKSVINAGKTGARMANNSTLTNWIPNYKATVAAQVADVYVILASSNDNGSVIGTIDSTDDTTYMGAYNNYLTYLLANIADIETKKLVLCTQPIIVGAGNTIAQGKAAYETQFINMANAVKALGVKYSLPVCDLHSLAPLTFENSPIYLADKVHWNTAMNYAVGDILGKFINNLF